MLAFPAAMLINYRGQRYMNEWLIHNTLASANTNVTQGDNGDFLALFNEKMVETLINEGPQALGVYVVPGGMTFPYTEPGFFKNIKEDLEVCIKVGLCVKGETIEDLAVQLRIDPAVLRSEVERYNAFCKNGRDEDFFKYPELLHAMEEGPYYAVRGTSESLGSVGGVRVDDELRVLTRKREVIPGLYCAGACAGGIWGNDSYGILEGATCSWAFNSGRMAGENAAEYVLSHK
jgi:fumarate reductase flavoprotein subunit